MQKSRTLELTYQDDERASLSAEYLRVFSPSAEVRGHSDGEHKLQTGKKHIEIKQIETYRQLRHKNRFQRRSRYWNLFMGLSSGGYTTTATINGVSICKS